MLIILIDIFINVRIRKRAVVQPNQACQQDQNMRRQNTLQKQMFILMLASICIFLITTLPMAIYKITSPRQADILTSIFQIITIWVGLLWFQSLNYAVSIATHIMLFFIFISSSIFTFTVSVQHYSVKNLNRI
jgi:cytochrome b subunit of formate dehydrogenase